MRKTRKEYTEANRIADAADQVELVCADVYDLPDAFSGAFDMVLVTIGVGLTLQRFTELDYDISCFCSDLEQSPTKPPLGFVMVMGNE